jgi:hypothetical protein
MSWSITYVQCISSFFCEPLLETWIGLGVCVAIIGTAQHWNWFHMHVAKLGEQVIVSGKCRIWIDIDLIL